MPFDATTTAVQVDPLQAIGITPVPEAVWRAYMRKVNDLYRGRLNAQWEFCRLPGVPVACGLKIAIRCLPSFVDDRTQSPKKIVRLAERVERSVPDVSFSLAYFYTDPILFVHYQIDGTPRKACLGIWDNGTVVAIAETEMQPHDFWRRLFRRS